MWFFPPEISSAPSNHFHSSFLHSIIGQPSPSENKPVAVVFNLSAWGYLFIVFAHEGEVTAIESYFVCFCFLSFVRQLTIIFSTDCTRSSRSCYPRTAFYFSTRGHIHFGSSWTTGCQITVTSAHSAELTSWKPTAVSIGGSWKMSVSPDR